MNDNKITYFRRLGYNLKDIKQSELNNTKLNEFDIALLKVKYEEMLNLGFNEDK